MADGAEIDGIVEPQALDPVSGIIMPKLT